MAKIRDFFHRIFIFSLYGMASLENYSRSTGRGREIPFLLKSKSCFRASVSLLNPHAILDTIGVIGTNSLVYDGFDRLIFTFACITVSWLWFFGLAYTGRKIGQIDTNGQFLKRMNQLSALIIWVIASLHVNTDFQIIFGGAFPSFLFFVIHP